MQPQPHSRSDAAALLLHLFDLGLLDRTCLFAFPLELMRTCKALRDRVFHSGRLRLKITLDPRARLVHPSSAAAASSARCLLPRFPNIRMHLTSSETSFSSPFDAGWAVDPEAGRATTSLVLSAWTLDGIVPRSLVVACPNLEALTLHHCRFQGGADETDAETGRPAGLGRLRHLRVCCVEPPTEQLDSHLRAAVARHAAVASLDITFFRDFPPRLPAAVAARLRHLAVRPLALHYGEHPHERGFVLSLSQCTSLRSLSVSGPVYNRPTLASWAAAMPLLASVHLPDVPPRESTLAILCGMPSMLHVRLCGVQAVRESRASQSWRRKEALPERPRRPLSP